MNQALALIIEDSDLLAEYFAQVLQAAGYKTIIAEDGRFAQQKLQELIPDIVLLDLNLPFVSGELLLAQIRNDARLSKTRVLIASADGTHARQLGDQADLVLQKPIDYHQLRILSTKLHPDYKPTTGSLHQA
ncbi:MAG: response regulator [Ardenticatenaceae bacterium]|nr:response regulator [Ardenticatenaceae bacterium]MCB9444930.1 response regulator [Ardenticatenaceae bacterium]